MVLMKKLNKLTLISLIFITLSCENSADFTVTSVEQKSAISSVSNSSNKSSSDDESVVNSPDQNPSESEQDNDDSAVAINLDDVSTLWWDQFRTAAVASDGSLYLAGETFSEMGDTKAGKGDILVIKLKPNGNLDENFAQNGIFQYGSATSNGKASLGEEVKGITLSSDEKSIFVVGFTQSALSGVKKNTANYVNYDGFVIKINSLNGQVDTEFGDGDGTDNDGVVQFTDENIQDSIGDDYARDVAFLDGSIFVSGNTTGVLSGKNSGGQDGFIIKMNADSGLFDKNFGSGDGKDNDGVLQINTNVSSWASSKEFLNKVFIDKSKNLFALSAGAVLKLNSTTGALDKKFGNGDGADSDGIAQINEHNATDVSEFDYISDFVVDNTGNIWLGGYSSSNLSGSVNGVSDSFIIKMTSTGELDKEFGDKDGKDNDGILFLNAGVIPGGVNREQSESIAVDNNGSVYLVGNTNSLLSGVSIGGVYDLFVVKVDAVNGHLDQQFGDGDGIDNDGILQLNNEQADNAVKSEYPTKLLLDGSGNIVIAGYTSGALSSHKGGQTDAFVIKASAESGVFSNTFGDGDGKDNDGILQINF